MTRTDVPRPRVLAIVNKWWECDPVVGVLLNDNARPIVLGWPFPLQTARPRPNPKKPLPPENPNPLPRAVFHLNQVDVEVWCISDLLEHLPSNLQSSTEAKAKLLPKIFRGRTPSLVIAVGTAALPAKLTQNGGVIVGTKVFMHNGTPNGNPDSKWPGPFDQVIPSSLKPNDFGAITSIDNAPSFDVRTRFLVAPLNPAPAAEMWAAYDYVALGTMNVTNYADYDTADPLTVQAFVNTKDKSPAGSVETTHGLIRVESHDAPFLFISGITDRIGFFHDDVDPRSYAQDTVAAHNAGVTLAWMLPKVDAIFH